jgi:excisionase family DNA binding protein
MKEDPPRSAPSSQGTPVWVRVPQAVQLTGLSRSKVYELLAAGRIRSASLRDPGQRHATRLIDRASLLEFIESHVDPR